MDVEKLCMGCMKELKQPGVCPHCGYRADSAGAEGHYLRPYTILNGKYLVGRVLGEGGFGITYIGYDLNLEMPVAIKEFYPNGYVTRESGVTSMVSAYQGANLEAVSKWKNNFIREARTLAKCSHLSGIVGVKDFFEENGTAYIVMEYLDGMNLKSYVKANGGKVEITSLLRSLEPVMASLSKVHEYGLIHRDISPDNIMLLPGGAMKLLDFGAARDYASEDEKSLSVMLKPGYAPEEQYRTKGKQGPWSDVYAFAATIYKCVTGVTPPESMERMRQDELKRPSELGIFMNPQMENALLKGMEVYAEKRYQSMAEFMNALYAGMQYTAAPMQPVPEQTALTSAGMPADTTSQAPVSQPQQTMAGNMSQTGFPSGTGAAGAAMDQTKPAAKIWELCQKYWIALAAAAGVLIAFIIILLINAASDSNDIGEMREEVAEVVPEKDEEPETVEEDPEDKAEEALENGKTKYAEGDYEEAFYYYEEARQLNPDNEEIYLLESEYYLQTDDLMNAVGILDEGIVQTGKITLDTRRTYLIEHTILVKQEKYYNGVLNEVQEYNPDGTLAAQYQYDGNGRVSEWGEYTYINGVIRSQVHYYENGVQKWGIAYHDDGTEDVYAAYDKASQMTDVYVAEYNGDGTMYRKVYYETRGLTINSSMDRVLRNGVKWWKVYDYDQNGNQIRDTSYNPDGSVSSWQEYYYDMDGNPTGTAAFYSDGTINGYNEVEYDDKGCRIAYKEYDGYGNLNRQAVYENDALGNYVKEQYYDNAGEVMEEISYVNTYQFNG
ncbi:MAG: protein kinase [Roseburia sp.]|nr:protein kinase [Roseburia sp.]MCM1242788.1 protein kinase [Roseburia sp.]